MCIAGALVMTAVIGGTLAGFQTSTEDNNTTGIANISVKELGIGMQGTPGETKGESENTVRGIASVPGGETVLQHNIVNNIEGGYDLYTRVTIDKKWTDKKELDPAKIRVFAVEDNVKEELIAGKTVNDWIVWYADAEQIIMYYTKPLAAGQATSNMIDGLSFDADMDNAYANATVEISFSADAVQAIAKEDSMPSEWGVYPIFDETGVITAIEE